MLEKALISRADRVQQILNGLFLSRCPLYTIYDNLVAPVLHHVGLSWERGKVTVFEEHLASQAIRDALIRLQGIIPIPKEKLGRAFCMNLSTELHDIALKMAQHLLEVRGFETFYTGQMTPMFDLDKIFAAFRPQRLYLSSSVILDPNKTQDEFNLLLDQAHTYNTDVYIGGRGFDLLSTAHPAIKARLHSFQEVFES
jgi:methanogenic corrinoid protein MtbC1